MSEPKIYVGENIDTTQTDYDVYIFLPLNFTGNKQQLIDQARLKFLELSERDRLMGQSKLVKQSIGVSPLPERPKRKRIGR